MLASTHTHTHHTATSTSRLSTSRTTRHLDITSLRRQLRGMRCTGEWSEEVGVCASVSKRGLVRLDGAGVVWLRRRVEVDLELELLPVAPAPPPAPPPLTPPPSPSLGLLRFRPRGLCVLATGAEAEPTREPAPPASFSKKAALLLIASTLPSL